MSGDHNEYQKPYSYLDRSLEEKREPVAWADMAVRGEDKGLSWTPGHFHKTPLYTAPPKRELTCVCGAVWEGETMVHPPREREWVGLTYEEIEHIADSEWEEAFVRMIEAKLKEKNT